jgi:phenylacetate-CoA ligase
MEAIERLLPRSEENYRIPPPWHAFRAAEKSVEAYQEVLREAEGTATLHAAEETLPNDEQWRQLPLLTKDNYINKFPLHKRVAGQGRVLQQHCSSGSTGKPTFWARDENDELASAHRFLQA